MNTDKIKFNQINVKQKTKEKKNIRRRYKQIKKFEETTKKIYLRRSFNRFESVKLIYTYT